MKELKLQREKLTAQQQQNPGIFTLETVSASFGSGRPDLMGAIVLAPRPIHYTITSGQPALN